MSGACPRCHRTVDHDFGIISCAGCGAILSIDFDGNVTLSEPGEMQSKEPTTSTIDLSDMSRIEIPNLAEPNNEPTAELMVESIAESIAEPIAEPIAEQFAEPIEQEYRPDAVWQVPSDQPQKSFSGEGEFLGTEIPEIDDAEIQSVEGLQPEQAEPANLTALEFTEDWLNQDPPPPPTPAAMDFSDVVQYANSTELDNSTLVYSLRIEGIDHKDTRKKVLEVLSDIRLNIHTKDLASTIKGGILELNDLSPIKANVIATRLREEAVTFRWRQDVFQSEPEPS